MSENKKYQHGNNSKKVPKTLTLDESEQLLKQLSCDPAYDNKPKMEIRNTTLALLMLDAGLRVNETRNLLINDLWFGKEPIRTLTVPAAIAKNHKARDIPFTERILQSLFDMHQEWWDDGKPGAKLYAFYSYQSTKPITTRQIENIVGKAGHLALNKKVTPHMLRHTFASRLIRKTNSRVVQQLLGHSSLTSTQIYLHPNSEDLKVAIAGLENEV